MLPRRCRGKHGRSFGAGADPGLRRLSPARLGAVLQGAATGQLQASCTPAADGGYYLIGLKKFHRRLFEAIDWSTERVYRQTIMRAAEIGVSVAPLAEWYDVDDEPSLAVLARDLLYTPGVKADHNGSYAAPRTTAFLAQLATKNGGVRHLFHGPPWKRCRTPPFLVAS